MGELVPVAIVLEVVEGQLIAAAEAQLSASDDDGNGGGGGGGGSGSGASGDGGGGSGRLRLKSSPAELSAALRASFATEVTIDLAQLISKLEIAISLEPTLRANAAAIAADVGGRIHRAHVSAAAARLMVVGGLDEDATAAAAAAVAAQRSGGSSGFASPQRSGSFADLAAGGGGGGGAAAGGGGASFGRVRAAASLLTAAAALPAATLWVEAEAALLEAAAMPSVDALLALDDAALVAALWRLSDGGAPLPLPSSHPTFIIYTSGTSGYRPRGLVGDTGGYCSGLARTMRLAFDVRNRRPGRKAGVARGCWLCARA